MASGTAMRTLVIALVFSVLALAASAHAQTATLTMLPEGFEVYDLSGDGRVVVGWVTNVTPRYAATWTREAGVQPIPKPAGWGETLARAVNHDATVIAGEAATPEGVRAFVYKPETGMVSIGVLPETSSSISLGVSSNGEWTCGWSGRYAYRYHVPSGLMEKLRTTSGEDSWDGVAVSDTGIVVGAAYNDEGGRSDPVEWPTPSMSRDLGPRTGNVWGGATGITPDGRWIVGTTDSPFLGQLLPPFPRMWDEDRTSIGLIAPGTPFRSGAWLNDVTNGADIVVGAVTVPRENPCAIFWTSQSGVVRLWDAVTTTFGLQSVLGSPNLAARVSGNGSVALLLWRESSLDPVRSGVLCWPPPCDVDCTLDWQIDIFDYLCFLNKYVEGDSYPCEFNERTYSGSGGGACDIHDLLAFQRRFVEGCR